MTSKRHFFDRFEVAIKALVPIDALRALLEHYRGVWRDGVAMSRKYVHNGMLAFHAFNDLNVFPPNRRIIQYISTVFKRNDGQPKIAAAVAVSPSPASSTGLKSE